MKVTYLGHSALMLAHNGVSLLIDPFITGNPLATVRQEDLAPQFILLTHGHADHVGDTLAIAKRTHATVVAPFELINLLEAEGLQNGIGMNIGGTFQFEDGTARLTPALHSSSYEGSYAGPACGYRIDWGGLKFYHAGDTDLFGDMRFFAEESIDYAFLPIGGRYTMDGLAALKAIRWIYPRHVIPMHCNTFPEIQADPDAFVLLVNETTGSQGLVLSPGATLELG